MLQLPVDSASCLRAMTDEPRRGAEWQQVRAAVRVRALPRGELGALVDDGLVGCAAGDLPTGARWLAAEGLA
eukprot:9368022-Alexandrium_andersonii.AAC.1